MLQVVRDANAKGVDKAGSGSSTTAVNLALPLTVLSCQPLLPLPVSTASSASPSPASIAPSLVGVVALPSPASSEWQPTAAASSALHSASVSRLPHLVVVQRTSTGHHYLFNYGTQHIRHNGRRLQQQRLPIRAHILRTNQWHCEQLLDQPHCERSEVQGTGGKPLEEGDQLELAGTLFVYWSHYQHDHDITPATTEGQQAEERGERTRQSSRRAVVRQRGVPDIESDKKRAEAGTSPVKRELQQLRRSKGERGSEADVVGEADPANDSNRKRYSRVHEPLHDVAAVASGSSSGTINGGVTADKPPHRPTRKRVRSRQGRLSESAIARIAAFAKQRQRGPNGAFLRVRDDDNDDDEDESDEDDELRELLMEEEQAEDNEREDRAEAGERLVPKAERTFRPRHYGLRIGSVSGDNRSKRRRSANGRAAQLKEEEMEESEEEEEKSNSATAAAMAGSPGRLTSGVAALAATTPAIPQLNGRAKRQAGQQSPRLTTAHELAKRGNGCQNGRNQTSDIAASTTGQGRIARKRQMDGADKRQRNQSRGGTAVKKEKQDRWEAMEQQAGVDEQRQETDEESSDRSGHSEDGHIASKRVMRARRSLRGKMRKTRSSGPVAVAENRDWPQPNERKRSRKSSHKHKKTTQLRRMRRTPLSLLPNPPATLLPLLPLLTCHVCNQLFVQPVSLACSHSYCDFCLYSRLQLKESSCPQCDRPVDDNERKRGTYAVRSAALESVAEAVAMQTLDVKGKRARARRQRVDAADMKHVRAAWKRMQGAERSRERRKREREQVEEELSALLGRRRYTRSKDSRANGSRQRVRASDDEDDAADLVSRPGRGSESDEDDEDFIPASGSDSQDSDARRHSDHHSTSGSVSDRSGSDDSSSASTSAGSSESIDSSESDSVDMDRSVILPQQQSQLSARRSRPQRSTYELLHVPKRSRPPCRGCSLPLNQSELAIRVVHGSDVRWSHIACLRFSTAGRTIPLHRIDGMSQLTASEVEAVNQAWHREADDGHDEDGVELDEKEKEDETLDSHNDGDPSTDNSEGRMSE